MTRRKNMKDAHDRSLRQQLVDLLAGGSAHAKFDDVVNGLPIKLRGTRPATFPHSPWMLLAHPPPVSVGHSRLQPKCKPRISGVASRVLAENRGPAELRRLEPGHRRIPEGFEGYAGYGRSPQGRPIRTY